MHTISDQDEPMQKPTQELVNVQDHVNDDAIIDLLQTDGILNVGQIADRLNCIPRVILNALKALATQGRVRQGDRMEWTLVE